MASSLIKRLLISLLTLFSVLILTFLLLHLIPGGPFDQEREFPPEIKQNLYQKYGLTQRGDQNFWIWFAGDLKAYLSYLKKGELGPSLKFRDRDVVEIIAKAVVPSMELAAGALSLALVFGVLAGLKAAARPEGLIDRFLKLAGPVVLSLPSFVKAVLLIMIFSFWLKCLPPALWEGIRSSLLPVLTLALVPLAYFAQLTRAGVLSQLRQDYVKTARAKGVPEAAILLKHALKNAATPILTVMGPMTAALITGSFVVETIFSIPGLGRHFVTAVIDRDYFLVMGITLFYASILIFLNWMVDVGYLWLDPRMRKSRG
ncbi:MAG: ABC transporter permease [Deltaproteobacteria bacterium]|nr:ABC transporter permease [Deltaproteobacteria bacterium]